MFDKIQSICGGWGWTAHKPQAATGGAPQSIPLRRLWWAAILLLGLSAGAVGWTIWQLRQYAIRTAIADTGSISAVLAGQLSQSLQSIDAVLLEVTNSQKELALDSPAKLRSAYDNSAFQRTLRQRLARLPQIFALVIADENGQLVVSTAKWPTPSINIADRDYFQSARTRRDGQLSASVPIKNRINGTQTIVFARRLESPNGRFVGVIFASVNSKYFEAIYGSIQSVHSLIFTLVRRDGTILFRHPDMHGFTGKKLSANETFQNAVATGASGFRILARADGNVRFVSARSVPRYPLFVNTSITEHTALAGWYRRAATIGLGSAALLLCSLYLLIAVTRQVRRLSESEASLMQKSQQLDAAINNMSQGLSMYDDQQRLVVCNKQYVDMYNLPPELSKPGTLVRELLQARADAGLHSAFKDFATDRIQQVSMGRSFCTIDNLSDGRIISITHQRMENGGWVTIHQDITAQKHAEEKLAHMARYDILTGLANRALFIEKASEALARMRRNGDCFSVLMLDLDRFKAVNDVLGHAIGDSLLQAVAGRLRDVVGRLDCVARLGGDEFAIIHPIEEGQKDSVIGLAANILDSITQPYDLDGRTVVIGTSIGITLAPQDADDADTLVRNADLALYKAKSEGRNRYRFFESAMQAEARDRRELEEDMRRAIACEEFELEYQTIMNLEQRQCCGAEALVRWRHPERGLIPPDQFITLAEESGLIVPLGAWILRRACCDAANWPAHLTVAVNLSPIQFKRSDLVETLKSALQESGLAPERLELEITETILVEKNEENLAALHQIKALGVSVVLDDFGTGYSSMRYLQMFPFDRIKIDKSFIQSMTNHADSAAIVGAIIGLGRSLEIETTAEGVETAEQLTLLRSAGCPLAQGYLFSRPAPLAELNFEQPQAMRDATRAA
jgi:diguanylate cyclase (GGDEF)-like protein